MYHFGFVVFEPGSCFVVQLGFRLRIFLLQPPRVLGLQRYFTVPFSLWVLAFLKIFYSFTVCTSGWPQTQDIPTPSTAFSPRLLLCVCGGGSFAHCTQPTPGMVLAGSPVVYVYEHTEEIQQSENRHTAVTWGCHLLQHLQDWLPWKFRSSEAQQLCPSTL